MILKKQHSKVVTLTNAVKKDVSDVFIHQLKTDLKETLYVRAAKGVPITD